MDVSGTKAAPEFMLQTEVPFLVGCGVLKKPNGFVCSCIVGWGVVVWGGGGSRTLYPSYLPSRPPGLKKKKK